MVTTCHTDSLCHGGLREARESRRHGGLREWTEGLREVTAWTPCENARFQIFMNLQIVPPYHRGTVGWLRRARWRQLRLGCPLKAQLLVKQV